LLLKIEGTIYNMKKIETATNYFCDICEEQKERNELESKAKVPFDKIFHALQTINGSDVLPFASTEMTAYARTSLSSDICEKCFYNVLEAGLR